MARVGGINCTKIKMKKKRLGKAAGGEEECGFRHVLPSFRGCVVAVLPEACLIKLWRGNDRQKESARGGRL